ncbi:MAG: LLM class F420-dependent oxidoreductase [Candidatus Hydrothermarchaeaceae archaeon]
MKVGFSIYRFDWPGSPGNIGSTLKEISVAAEQAGFSSIWVMDHFFQLDEMVGPAEDPMLEAYSTLGFLAGSTKRMRLGTLVSGVIYRNPGLLVKAVTSLDVVSGGRANFGIGAAWYEREAMGLGFPFPALKERYERLEETIQIAKKMWSGDTSPYKGKHYQLAEPINSPQPITKPHPPILIGGGGEKKTLRLVAQYADACNLFAMGGIDDIAHKLDVLRHHCEDIGRPYDEIERTVLSMAHMAPDSMTVSDVINSCRDLAKLGIQHVIFAMPNIHEIEIFEKFGEEIIPAVSEF